MVLPASAEVIDLSLDDTPAKAPKHVQPSRSKVIEELVVLSDDSESGANEALEWEDRPTKRRRRSPSLETGLNLDIARDEDWEVDLREFDAHGSGNIDKSQGTRKEKPGLHKEDTSGRSMGQYLELEDFTGNAVQGRDPEQFTGRSAFLNVEDFTRNAHQERDSEHLSGRSAFLNVEDFGRKGTREAGISSGPRPAGSFKRTVTLSLDGSDPILCGSSPRQTARRVSEEAHEYFTLQDDDSNSIGEELPSNFSYLAKGKGKGKAGSDLSDRTLALLANISSNDRTGIADRSKARSTGATRRNKNSHSEFGTEQDLEPVGLEDRDGSQHETHTTKAARKRLTETEKADAKAKREQDKQKKLAEKEAEKERKQRAKEEKAREKQAAADLAQVNKSRTDKKLSTPEMVVDLPDSLEDSPVDEPVKSFLRNLGVETSTYRAPVRHVIKWRRKVTAVYSDELDHWEPVPERVTDEKLVMCLMSAQELVKLICADANRSDAPDLDAPDLDAHVARLKHAFQDRKLMFLVEGLATWMRKNKNVRNRAYRAAVIQEAATGAAAATTAGAGAATANADNVDDDGGAGNGGGDGARGVGEQEVSQRQGRRPRKKQPQQQQQQQEYVDEDMVEDGLLRLQVMHTCLVHHTASAVETAEWVAIFTQHISTIPYKWVMRISYFIDRDKEYSWPLPGSLYFSSWPLSGFPCPLLFSARSFPFLLCFSAPLRFFLPLLLFSLLPLPPSFFFSL